MAQVAVAVLDVHELEAGAGRELGRVHELQRQSLDLRVGQHGMVSRNAKPAIEHGMVIDDDGLGPAPGPGEAAGVRQLQADEQIVAAPELRLVRLHQGLPQLGQAAQVPFVDQELVGVRAAVGPHRHRLAAPDQLGAALPEADPAPASQRAGESALRPVPAFHGLDAEAIAECEPVGKAPGLGQRPRGVEAVVGQRQREAKAARVAAKLVRAPQRGHAPIIAHPGSRQAAMSRAISASTARSLCGRAGAPGGVPSSATWPVSLRNCAAL